MKVAQAGRTNSFIAKNLRPGDTNHHNTRMTFALLHLIRRIILGFRGPFPAMQI